MSREKVVEVEAAIAGAGPSRVFITQIGSKAHPTFVPRRVLTLDKGAEILVAVQELRHHLKAHESKVFAWLEAAPGNPEKYTRDPLGSLTEMGIRLDPETREKLAQVASLLKQATPSVNRKEG